MEESKESGDHVQPSPLDFTKPPPDYEIIDGSGLCVEHWYFRRPNGKRSGKFNFEEEAITAAWVDHETTREPPGMRVGNVGDNEWLFMLVAAPGWPKFGLPFRSQCEARAAAWDLYRDRAALYRELDKQRRVWATTPGIRYSELDHEQLAWPLPLTWSGHQSDSVKRWLADPETELPEELRTDRRAVC